MGKLGAGKSTVGNVLTGTDNFSTGHSAESVTKGVTKIESKAFGATIYDTPGFGDPAITTKSWLAGAQKLSTVPISGIIFVCNATERVGNDAVTYALAIKHVVSTFTPSRVYFIFTHTSAHDCTPESC